MVFAGTLNLKYKAGTCEKDWGFGSPTIRLRRTRAAIEFRIKPLPALPAFQEI